MVEKKSPNRALAESLLRDARGRLRGAVERVEENNRQQEMTVAERLDRALGAMAPDGLELDREALLSIARPLSFFYRNYFRCVTTGIEHLPEGPFLLAANHSGQLPWDGAMLAAALFFDGEPPRVLRALVDRRVEGMPVVGGLYRRWGQVSGTVHNAELLFARGDAVLVFPEGVRGIVKPSRQRYQLQRFSSGFARLALRHAVPVVPVGIVGAEEQYFSFGNAEAVAKWFGLPALPLAPQLLLPGGQLPLPTRYHLRFGEPRLYSGSELDRDTVAAAVRDTEERIAELVREGLTSRRGVFS